MKTFLLGSAALACLLGGSAVAADLPVKAPPKIPAAIPVYDWTGFYLGGHCGGAWGRARTSNLTVPEGGFDSDFLVSYDRTPAGGLCGGQLGYNWQAANWVFGLEGDLGYLGLKKESILSSPDRVNGDSGDFVSVKYDSWYATATGRLGYSWNQWLLYVKGGAAWAHIRNSAADVDNGTEIDPSDFVQISKTRTGWALGGGLEYLFAPQWSAKLEYLYLDFGAHTVSHFDTAFDVVDQFELRNRVHTVKLGLNYHFNWR